VAAFSLLSSHAFTQIHNTWRGPDRDGVYPETGLLTSWPEGGPEMKWAYEELGKGFSSPVLANGKIYITGLEKEMGYIYILSLDGSLLKKYPYGAEEADNYPGTRSTPNIIGDIMYVATSLGKLLSMDLITGNTLWTRDLFSDFDGSNIRWGLTENLLIDGDVIYIAPGGKVNNVVALNRHNGELIWTGSGMGELSAYCSPLLINHNGNRILVTMMGTHIMGMKAEDGTLLWSFPYKNRHNIYPNTPIYRDNSLLFFSGYGKGSVRLRLNHDGSEVTKIWENETFDNQMGGVILHEGYLYGSGHNNRRWFVVDWESGEIRHESRDIDKGTVVAADGMLYAYTERGELALIKPLHGTFEIVGSAAVTLGSDQHWAHLVIHDGVLYLRHGNALIAYNIRK
jgi:outer membrane protein assembly factor BamB